MATRHLIDRLSERIEAVTERLRPRRTFQLVVAAGEDKEAKTAAFVKEHGVTDNDLLLVVCLVRSPNTDYDGTWQTWVWTKDGYRQSTQSDCGPHRGAAR
jgi:hypothetical protein